MSLGSNFFRRERIKVSLTRTKDSPIRSSGIPMREPKIIHTGYIILMNICAANLAMMKFLSKIAVSSTSIEPIMRMKKKILKPERSTKGRASLISCKRGEMKYHSAVTPTINRIRLIVESQMKSAFPTGLGLVCEFFIDNICAQAISISGHCRFALRSYFFYKKQSIAG